MNRKKRLAVFVAFALVLICLSACRAALQAGFTPDTEVQSTLDITRTEEPDGTASMESQTTVERRTGVFDFERRTVLLNSGYTMPIMGLGTYALDHDACVNSVMALLANGGRLIDTAYMYGNEEAVGEGIRQAMAEYGIPREDIFVITKIYPNQFHDPEAAIDIHGSSIFKCLSEVPRRNKNDPEKRLP